MHTHTPPDGLPIYRLLTGPDDAEFCRRVSDAVALGYRLYGPPTIAIDGKRVVAGQALVWPTMEFAIAAPPLVMAPPRSR